MNKYDQISPEKFLEKYGGLALYDEDAKNGYTIDNEDIKFSRKSQGIGFNY